MTDSDKRFVEKITYGLQIYVLHRRKEGYNRGLLEDMIFHIMEVLSKWIGR